MLLLPLNTHSTLSVSLSLADQLPITTGSLLILHMALLTPKISSLDTGFTFNIYEPSMMSNTVLKIYLKISIVLPNLSIINKSNKTE